MSTSSPFRNPICVALDVDSRDEALRLADQLADVAGGFKVGPRLCLRYGQDLIKELASRAPVFVDNKHFDIPSTMEAAIQASFEAGASVVTVHALAGYDALLKVAKLEAELQKQRPFRVLAVTILTSWDEGSLPSVMKPQELRTHVLSLAELTQTAGLSSLVCSPHELEILKNRGHYLVTPGIRFEEDSADDQKRVMTPQAALSEGASALVMGRTILRAKDPREAVKRCQAPFSN